MGNIDISSMMAAKVGGYTLSKLLYTALIALICLLVIRLSKRLMLRLMTKSRLNERLRKAVMNTVMALLYIISFIIVADYLGINMNSLVALLSVGSLGITLAAEDILGNMAGGVVVLSSRLFVIGDFIEVNGTQGTVKEIGINHTRLSTMDGLLVLLPNKELANSKVTNYTALGMRRVKLTVTASYDAPTEQVKSACMEAVAAAQNVLDSPAPTVNLTNYRESAIEYAVCCWTTPDNYWQVYFDVAEGLRESFRAHDVEMTYEHINVHIVESLGTKQ